MKSQVSLIVCTYNSTDILSATLSMNLNLSFKEIIIVDGFSTDGIERITGLRPSGNPPIRLFQRPKLGLGDARNFGTIQAIGKYVLHAGPDNFFTEETLLSMLSALENYDLVSCRTDTFSEGRGYLHRAHKIYKMRFSAGLTEIVGTPYMAKKSLFAEFPFDPQMAYSDDTELCSRLVGAKKTIFRVSESCYEIGFDDLPSIVERWTRWGRSDAQFFRTMSPGWTWRRKLRSIIHPISTEISNHYRLLSTSNFLLILPFLLLVVMVRYMGWISYFAKNRRA